MKILVINWQDIKNPLGGGAEVHFHEIFKRIAARGHQVTLFCSRFPDSPEQEIIDGIRILRQGSRNLFNYSVYPRYKRQFSKEKYDVVVDDINKIPFYTPLFVKEPLAGIVHHLFGKSIFSEASLPAALYVYGAERMALPVYRNIPIAVVSESTKKEMVSLGFKPEDLMLAPNAVHHQLFRVTGIQRSESPLIGYLGRIKKYKSVDHLLYAFALVVKQIPDARLVVVGDGDALDGLKHLAGTLGIGHAVEFTGYVSEEKKVEWLNTVQLAVNPSAKEGWGLTVIEANACGIPVIASDVPGLRDSVVNGKTGILFEYGNINMLAEQIIAVLRDLTLRQRLSAEALLWAKTFNWESSADMMLDVLRTAIERHRKR